MKNHLEIARLRECALELYRRSEKLAYLSGFDPADYATLRADGLKLPEDAKVLADMARRLRKCADSFLARTGTKAAVERKKWRDKIWYLINRTRILGEASYARELRRLRRQSERELDELLTFINQELARALPPRPRPPDTQSKSE